MQLHPAKTRSTHWKTQWIAQCARFRISRAKCLRMRERPWTRLWPRASILCRQYAGDDFRSAERNYRIHRAEVGQTGTAANSSEVPSQSAAAATRTGVVTTRG